MKIKNQCPSCSKILNNITKYVKYCDYCGYILIDNSGNILLKSAYFDDEDPVYNVKYLRCVPYINRYCKRLLIISGILSILSILTLFYSRIY